MNKTPVRFFICTDNYFLYKGIVCSLSERMNFKFMWVKETYLEIVEQLQSEDVVLLLQETHLIDFYFLKKLCTCECKVIMTNSEKNWMLNIMFDFVMINRRFYLSDLLLALHAKNKTIFHARYPNFTRQEKKVLFYTSKGYSVSDMSIYMGISEKTLYQHQRNALKKIGMDKPRGVVALPKNLLEYLFHQHH